MFIKQPGDLIVSAVVPLDEFCRRCGEGRIRFLQQYGIGVEDILTEAFRYRLTHVIEVERVWFNQFADTKPATKQWHVMQGNPASTADLPNFLIVYLDVLFLMYSINFRYFELVSTYFGIEPDERVPRVQLLTCKPHGEDCVVSFCIDYDNNSI